MTDILLDGERASPSKHLYRLVFDGAVARIDPAATARMNASRAVIERLIASDNPRPEAVYGVNTRFWQWLSTVRISRDQIGQLQLNLRYRGATRAGSAPRSMSPPRERCSLFAPMHSPRDFRAFGPWWQRRLWRCSIAACCP